MIEVLSGPNLLQSNGRYAVEYSFRVVEKRPKRLPRSLKLSWSGSDPNLGLVGEPTPLDSDRSATVSVPILAVSDRYRILLWDNNRAAEPPLWEDRLTLDVTGESPHIVR